MVLKMSCNSRPTLEQKTPESNKSDRKLRFQGFCRPIRLIERVFWSFYSTVRSYMQYCLAFSWSYKLLSDKVLRITVYSCANAPAGPHRLQPPRPAPAVPAHGRPTAAVQLQRGSLPGTSRGKVP